MIMRRRSDGSQADLAFKIEGPIVRRRTELASRVELLYQEHYDGLYRYLLLSGSFPADADEFIQEAFFRLFRTLRSGKPIEKPRNWLLRVIHNIRADEARRSIRLVQFDAAGAAVQAQSETYPSATPETELLQQERFAHLRISLAKLTKRQYQYLLLRAEGLKLREIAEMFGVSLQSVAETCTRAIDQLGRLTHE